MPASITGRASSMQFKLEREMLLVLTNQVDCR